MASWTKNARTIVASTTNAAGATATGSTIDLTTASGGVIGWKVTNGATGPTVACSIQIQYSRDNFSTNWIAYTRVTDTGNNVITQDAWTVPIGVMYARAVFTGNTAQTVTVEAYLMEATSFG